LGLTHNGFPFIPEDYVYAWALLEGEVAGRGKEMPTATEENEGENVYDALGGLKS